MKAGEKNSVIQREMEDVLDQLKKRKVANPKKHRRERSAHVRMSASSKKTLHTEVLETDGGGGEFDAFDNLLPHHHHHKHDQMEKDLISEVQSMNQKNLSDLNEHK
jgi:hypothetical protein